MKELEEELKRRFNWIVWDLDGIIRKEGGPLGAVKFLINLLWEQYYSKKPLLSRTEIVSWIGELENLLSKYREGV
jgi:hypothetical protein